MFICLDCFLLFETECDIKEDYGEKRTGCSKCGGAYTTAFRCSECGEYIDSRYIKTANKKRICEECYEELQIGDESWW